MEVELATGPDDLISSAFKLYPYNPDELVLKKGLKIYDDMKKDDQVKACLSTKKLARLSTKSHVKPASKDAKDIEVAKFYAWALENMPGTQTNVLLGLMTALDYGYSVSEIVLKYIEGGFWKGKIGIKAIKTRKPHDFEFRTDTHMNIESLIQYQSGFEVPLPIEKFILWSNDPEWGNPYGISDLKAGYRAWWMKDVVMKFWGIFLERYPSPIFIGRYPPGLPEKEKSALLKILVNLQIKTAGIIPQGVQIDTIEVGKSGSKIYDDAIGKLDRQICRSLLVPDLLGMSDTPSKGSYALGKKHFDVFLWILVYLGEILEEIWHEQFTKPFIDLNFDVKGKYPKWKLEEITEESMETRSKILAQLAQAKFINPEDPAHREWASDFLTILPGADTRASAMAEDALDFTTPLKFYSPSSDGDLFNVEILENEARLQKFEDAWQKQ